MSQQSKKRERFINLPIEVSVDVFAEFVVGDEVSSFVSPDEPVEGGVHWHVVFVQTLSKAAYIDFALGVVLDDSSDSLLEGIIGLARDVYRGGKH